MQQINNGNTFALREFTERTETPMSIAPNSYRAMHKVNNDGLFSASVGATCDFRKTALLQYACDVGMSQRRRLFDKVEN